MPAKPPDLFASRIGIALHRTGSEYNSMSNAVQSRVTRDARVADGFDEAPFGSVVPIRPDADEPDPLASFRTETANKSWHRASRYPVLADLPVGTMAKKAAIGVLAVAGVLLVGVAAVRGWRSLPLPAASAATGTLALNSRPVGMRVVVDGTARGVTPIEFELQPGEHDVVFKSGATERKMRVTVDSGSRIVENIEIPPREPRPAANLDVTSAPPGARVTVDGRPVGQTPLKLRDVEPGRHQVVIGAGATAVRRTVEVAAGPAASLFVTLGSAPPGSTGSVVVESPAELRLLENDQLIGVSNAAPLPLAPGEHQFELVNDALELRLTRTATIEAGKITTIKIAPPDGVMFVNAVPWAEVFVDGRSVGVTPLGNVALSVGSHEVVWRHPQFGERSRSVTVSAQTPVRVAVDMTR